MKLTWIFYEFGTRTLKAVTKCRYYIKRDYYGEDKLIDDKDSEGMAQKVKSQTKSCAGYSVKYLKI